MLEEYVHVAFVKEKQNSCLTGATIFEIGNLCLRDQEIFYVFMAVDYRAAENTLIFVYFYTVAF